MGGCSLLSFTLDEQAASVAARLDGEDLVEPALVARLAAERRADEGDSALVEPARCR